MIPSRSGLNLSVAAVQSPVTLDQLKQHLRIEGLNFEDDNLQHFLDTAVSYVQELSGIQLCPATWIYSLPCFPNCSQIEIPLYPISTITSITYYDQNNALQTFSSAAYSLDSKTRPNRIILKSGSYSWPDTSTDLSPTVNITLEAGWSDAAKRPLMALQLIRWFASDLYLYRSDTVEKRLSRLPNGLSPFLYNLRGGCYY